MLGVMAASALTGCDPPPPSVRGSVNLGVSIGVDGSVSTDLTFDDTRTRGEEELGRLADGVAERLFPGVSAVQAMLVTPARFELATHGLGNRCSIP